jgi:hypothetical protein
MVHKEQTYTTHSFTFRNTISDAQTLEMILKEARPCLWDKGKKKRNVQKNTELFK